jgi:hypothetical protein
MAISDNIKAKVQKIKQEMTDSGGTSQTAQDLQTKATNAILGGGADYVIYMQMFAGDPVDTALLAKLIPTDPNLNDQPRRVARAYLLRNGMCGEQTTLLLGDNVTVVLD